MTLLTEKNKKKKNKITGLIAGGKGSFSSQLFHAFLIIGIPVFAAVAVCFYLFLLSSADRQICEEQSRELYAVYAQASFVFTDTENMSEEILINAAVQDMLEKSAAGQQYPSDTAVSNYINNLAANRDYIEGVVLSGTDHTLFSTERIFTDYSSLESIRKEQWFREMTEEDTYVWNQTAGRILLARPVYSMKDYRTLLGYVVIYLNDDYLQKKWNSCVWGDTTNIGIFDEKGAVIVYAYKTADYMEQMKQLFSKGYVSEYDSRIVSLDGKKYVYSNGAFGSDSWRISMIVPYHEVSGSVTVYQAELLILFAAFVFIMFLLSRIITGNKAKPIIELSEIMDAVTPGKTEKEKLRENDYAERTDEIGQMYRSFASMRERQEQLIKDVYLKDLEKKDAELALLQTQINPHFLYNTLNSINWMALANDQEEISEMITALSDTFRLSLMKKNSSYIELEKEIQYVQSYLKLQKMRYGSRLEYEIQMNTGSEKLYIPRFILQPVIENALQHGIDSMEEGGRLDIIIQTRGDILELAVINDNDCIDLDKMDHILKYDPEQGVYNSFKKEGYGVQNINRRIRILCGEGYGLSYMVKEGRTWCVIRVPVMKEEPDSILRSGWSPELQTDGTRSHIPGEDEK